jgi:hypothetical protein
MQSRDPTAAGGAVAAPKWEESYRMPSWHATTKLVVSLCSGSDVACPGVRSVSREIDSGEKDRSFSIVVVVVVRWFGTMSSGEIVRSLVYRTSTPFLR